MASSGLAWFHVARGGRTFAKREGIRPTDGPSPRSAKKGGRESPRASFLTHAVPIDLVRRCVGRARTLGMQPVPRSDTSTVPRIGCSEFIRVSNRQAIHGRVSQEILGRRKNYKMSGPITQRRAVSEPTTARQGVDEESPRERNRVRRPLPLREIDAPSAKPFPFNPFFAILRDSPLVGRSRPRWSTAS
ncbi:MAG: hypothetical protein RL591_2621 [Planctomycetota bacterium]